MDIYAPSSIEGNRIDRGICSGLRDGDVVKVWPFAGDVLSCMVGCVSGFTPRPNFPVDVRMSDGVYNMFHAWELVKLPHRVSGKVVAWSSVRQRPTAR